MLIRKYNLWCVSLWLARVHDLIINTVLLLELLFHAVTKLHGNSGQNSHYVTLELRNLPPHLFFPTLLCHLVKLFVWHHLCQLFTNFLNLLVYCGQRFLVNFVWKGYRLIVPLQSFMFSFWCDLLKLLHVEGLPLELDHFFIVAR